MRNDIQVVPRNLWYTLYEKKNTSKKLNKSLLLSVFFTFARCHSLKVSIFYFWGDMIRLMKLFFYFCSSCEPITLLKKSKKYHQHYLRSLRTAFILCWWDLLYFPPGPEEKKKGGKEKEKKGKEGREKRREKEERSH